MFSDPPLSFYDILAPKLSVRKKVLTQILLLQVGVTLKLDIHTDLFYQNCALEQGSYPKVSHRDFPYN